MYLDWTYIVMVLPAVLFSLWASAHVKRTYKTYSERPNSRGITGAEAARRVLASNGLGAVPVMQTDGGELSDHYDPKADVISLSQGVYNSSSAAAVGVACHEAGHAIQHAQGYLPARIRTAIVPVTNFGSKLSIPLIIAGLLLASLSPKLVYLAYAGIICYALCVVFQLVTLPTEFDASRRALRTIEDSELLYGDDLKGARRVLSAAALTYVAALAVTLMQLLRFILLVSGGRRRS